jgi:hypothetical protein
MAMIDFDEARRRAEELIGRTRLGRRGELTICDQLTRAEDFGWVFFYDSRRYLETNDPAWALGGNAPIIVDKDSGVAELTGTSHPIEYYITAYRTRSRSSE